MPHDWKIKVLGSCQRRVTESTDFPSSLCLQARHLASVLVSSWPCIRPWKCHFSKGIWAECKSLVIYYMQRSLPALPHSGKHCLDSSNVALIVLSHGEDCCFHSSWNGGVESVKLHLLLALAQTDLCIIPSSQVWDYRSLPSLSVNAGWCYSSVRASSSLDLILIQLIQALFLCSVIGSGISIFPLSFVWERSC